MVSVQTQTTRSHGGTLIMRTSAAKTEAPHLLEESLSPAAVGQATNVTSPAPAPHAPFVVKPDKRPDGLLGKLQMLGAVSFLGLMGYAFYIIIFVALYIVLGYTVLGHRVAPTILLGIWIGQALIPVQSYQQNPKELHKSWLFREMARYFDCTLVMEQKLDTSRHYLFAQFPHGTLPICSVLAAYYVDIVVPDKKIFCLIHTGILHLPIVRFFLGWWGALPADKEEVAKVRHHCYANVSIVVGGVSEIFLQDDQKEQLRFRKGFIREALKNGYDIVPMFHYGCTRMFDFVGPASFWRWVSYKLPFPFFLIRGWGGFTLFPKKTPVVIATGAPLEIAQIYGIKEGELVPEPDPVKVDLIYEKFKVEITKFYYRNRPAWEKRDLVIYDDNP